MPLPNTPEWENLCRRCGRCCYEKVEYLGQIYSTEVPCEFLDLRSKLCTVYAQRCQRKPGCVKLNAEIIALRVLPAGCAYVREIENYRPPQDWSMLAVEVRDELEFE